VEERVRAQVLRQFAAELQAQEPATHLTARKKTAPATQPGQSHPTVSFDQPQPVALAALCWHLNLISCGSHRPTALLPVSQRAQANCF
jgi:hypothetical protein